MAWGLEFMEGGRRWQVRGISFQIIVEQKNSILTALEKGIDMNLFYWSFY